MAQIISICNQKGGTGKTTTAVNLSFAIAQLGKKVLIVDTDPQGNATSGVGVNKSVIEISAYDVLLNKCSAQEATIQNVFFNLDIIPCNINLTGAEIELVGVLSRETRLKRALEEVEDNYDYIFIDSPPSLGLLTLNSLVAAHSLIIPIQCEFYALEGVSQLLNTINLVREGLNTGLFIEGVLLTMADFRTNLTSEVIGEIRSFFKDKVYKTIITRNIKLSEAPSFGKPIMLYDAHSVGARRYVEFAREFLERRNDFAEERNPLTTNELQKTEGEKTTNREQQQRISQESFQGENIQ